MAQKIHTKDYLAQELTKAGLDEMAAKAASGYYHDFLSPLDMPCLQLMTDLETVGSPEAVKLIDRHASGEFDASMEESNEWYHSAEGQACVAAFKGSIDPSKPEF